MELLAILLCIIMCFVNGKIAEYKGYSGIGFGLISILNWPLPLLILLCLPMREKEDE